MPRARARNYYLSFSQSICFARAGKTFTRPVVPRRRPKSDFQTKRSTFAARSAIFYAACARYTRAGNSTLDAPAAVAEVFLPESRFLSGARRTRPRLRSNGFRSSVTRYNNARRPARYLFRSSTLFSSRSVRHRWSAAIVEAVVVCVSFFFPQIHFDSISRRLAHARRR